MAIPFDLDQLRTFLAIAETGSFTRAAEIVDRTQSAISMQMRQFEERIGKQIFVREGRGSRLTEEGQRLLGYARRMVRLSNETVAALGSAEPGENVTLGLPEDYAEAYLPVILGAFAESCPGAEVSVVSELSPKLREMAWRGELDVAVVTSLGAGDTLVVRHEPLLWVSSEVHHPETEQILPLALFGPACPWRAAALNSLAAVGRKYEVRYVSANCRANAAAVLAGLAVSVIAEASLRPGMRILGEADGLPPLPGSEVGIVRSWGGLASPLADVLADQIVASLRNHSGVHTVAAHRAQTP